MEIYKNPLRNQMLAKKVDLNQQQIVKDLRKLGCVVTDLSKCGKGIPDLLVSYQNNWYLFELKNPMQSKSGQKLTGDEQKWINKQKAPVFIIRNIGDALEVFFKVSRKL